MFLITNRANLSQQGPTTILGGKSNTGGSLELRLVEAQKRDGRWQLRVLPDTLTAAMKREVGIDQEGDVVVSRYVARKVLAQVNPRRVRNGSRRQGKNLLFFVHGYNNNVKAVLDRADGFARTYGVEVVSFAWPANGGGLRGVASYKSDKRDAKASVGAMDRTLAKFYEYLNAFFEKGAVRNTKIKRFFNRALNGERAETDLQYDAATGMYLFR